MPLPFRRALALLPALALSAGIAATAAAERPAQRPAQRPNVVVVLTDDLDLMLGTLDHLPNIRRLLADSGVTFTNATVTNALCCPSRATLLRGQYTHGHRVYSNAPPTGGHARFVALGRDTSTLAVWLQRAGYRTALLGKYMNGYPGGDPTRVPPGWTTWASPVVGGYRMFGYTMNEDGTRRAYGETPDDYITDVLLRQSRAFIQRTAEAGAPFFLEIATYAPHGPSTPAPRHAALLPELRMPRTPSFDESDLSDKPAPMRRPPIDAAREARLDSLYRQRVRSMLAVDELVAGVVSTLAERGQLARTWILFTSDNGFHLGQHRLPPGKTTAYEEDVRVPFIVRGPGAPRGARVDALVENVDIAPTVAALAGVPVPDFVDGRSLVPLLRGERPASWRRVALVEAYPGAMPDARAEREGQRGAEARPARPRARRGRRAAGARRGVAVDAEVPARYVALRGERFTYVAHRSGARELYDLARDPYQLDNLADRADPAVMRALDAWAGAMHGCAGAQCREVSARVPEALGGLFAPPEERPHGMAGTSRPAPRLLP